ncbi:MAG: hypothetical protein KDD75_16545, partial [Caldilineaceae bacterium]|nr:hypothetical protein [Caldilineaceae bacterium]
MKVQTMRSWPILALAGALSLALAGCGGMGAQATPLPTRTPLPTFTATPEQAAQPVVQQPAQDVQQPAQGQTDPAAAPAEQPAAPAETPTPEPTPTTQAAQLVLSDLVNIRSGPGTTYSLLGSEQPGTIYRVTAKSPDGAC